MYKILMILIKSPSQKQEFIYNLDKKDWVCLAKWVSEFILKDKTMKVEDWIKTSFYLMKERWDSSMDWLEKQPTSKIMYMIKVSKDHSDTVKNSFKNSGRK